MKSRAGGTSSGVARLVVGAIGSGVTHRLGRTAPAVRCVGLETAGHPFEAFLPVTGGVAHDDANQMGRRMRASLAGSPLTVDDAHLLSPEALDVIDDLASDHEVVLGAHPGEGNWALLLDRWPDTTVEWVVPVPEAVVTAVIALAAAGSDPDHGDVASHVGPLPGIGRSLTIGGPLAAATRDRLASIVGTLDVAAVDWLIDATVLPPDADRSVLSDGADASFGLGDAVRGVAPVVAEVVAARAGAHRVDARRRALAERVTDPLTRARLLLEAGAVAESKAFAAEAFATADDPDRRARLSALAVDDDDSAIRAAALLVERERPMDAADLLSRLDRPDRPDALTVAAAVRRQLDSSDRWDLLERLTPGEPERRRQDAWFEAAVPGRAGQPDEPSDQQPAGAPATAPDPTTIGDLDCARWTWTARAARVLSGPTGDGLGPVTDALDQTGLNDSWCQLVRHLRAIDRWHRAGADRTTVEEMRPDCLPALPRALLGAHRAIGLADLGDTAAAMAIVAELPASAPSERMLAAWAAAEVELAAGRPVAAIRAASGVDDLDHPLVGLSHLVRAWALWDSAEPHSEPTEMMRRPGRGEPILRAVAIELDALDLVRGNDHDAAARAFDDAAAHWRGIHARGELRCRYGAAEARRLAGSEVVAIERLTVLEQACAEGGYGPLLQRVRRSLRRAGVRRRGRRTAGTGPLSPRETEVIELVGKGLTSRDIATRLGVATTTVETQIAAAMHKLGARTRLQAALAYRELAR